MVNYGLLSELSQLLLKYGATLEDILAITYPADVLDPKTEKYRCYFSLEEKKEENLKKYPDGFRYKIRYKKDLSGKTIKQGTATHTTRTAILDEAVKEGFEHRIEAIKRYELNKGKPKNGNDFYKMLNEYYSDDSKYLKDDFFSTPEMSYENILKARAFIRDVFIPYLKEKKIKDISEIEPLIFNGFKTLLQEQKTVNKTKNNNLSWVFRIFNYHIRNRLLKELPYVKGTAMFKITGEEETEAAELLPIEKLKGIFPPINLIDPIKLFQFINTFEEVKERETDGQENILFKSLTDEMKERKITDWKGGELPDGDIFEQPDIIRMEKPIKVKEFCELTDKQQKIIFKEYVLPLTIGILALNTGMRNSEIARLKQDDFIGVKEKKMFILRIWNHKTARFQKTKEGQYRKIALHPYTAEAVKQYLERKKELYGPIEDDDYLFGVKKVVNKKTGAVDGYLSTRHFDKVALLILKLIKNKGNDVDFFSTVEELTKLREYKALKEELKEEQNVGTGITFYSCRKTFRTMLGLNTDDMIAEYFMGHNVGNKTQSTYIQINKMDNKLFVDEYAEPVITMLNKYIFYTDEELEKMREDKRLERKKRGDYVKEKMNQVIEARKSQGINEIKAVLGIDTSHYMQFYMDYYREELEKREAENADKSKDDEYYSRI